MHVLIYAFIFQAAFQSRASEMHQYNLKQDRDGSGPHR